MGVGVRVWANAPMQCSSFVVGREKDWGPQTQVRLGTGS